MKIIKLLSAAIGACIFFSGCANFNYANSNAAEEQCDEIIRCLNEKDKERLEDMFCYTVKSSSNVNLDEQIETIFDLFNNETIVSYEKIIGSEHRSYNEGKCTELEIYPIIRPVELSNGDKYEIYFFSYVVYDNNPNNEGVSEITFICDETSVEYKIGDVHLIHPNVD
jgi:hypothetical protein